MLGNIVWIIYVRRTNTRRWLSMYNDIIKLLAITETTNAQGDLIETITERQVFAKRKSVKMSEAYAAMATGLKAELIFVLADYLDYDGEDYIEHNSIRYRVLRTYVMESNELEITVTR